jgi:hypothetical protein
MNIELSDQSSEYDAGAIVEVALVICLKNLTGVQGSYQIGSPDYIMFSNNRSIGNFGSGSCIAFLCPLSDSALRATGRHDSAKNNHNYLPKITSRILEKRIHHYNGSKMDFPKITTKQNNPTQSN